MSQWLFHNPVNNERIGPLDDSAARAVLQANPNLMVWREGMVKWTPASDIPEFTEHVRPAALPAPKATQRKYGCGTLIVGLIMLFGVAMCWKMGQAPEDHSLEPENPAVSDKQSASPSTNSTSTEAIKDAPYAGTSESSRWNYSSDNDSMSGKTSHEAFITSTNSFEFGFPYSGEQHATLEIRHHPRYGNDVIFSIEKGQILCSTYGNCNIRVRFDDEQAHSYQGNEPADHSSENVFLPGYSKFVQRLQKSNKVRIEVDIFQQGSLVAEFDTSGFDPSKLK